MHHYDKHVDPLDTATEPEPRTWPLAWLLLIGGGIGLAASFVLSYEDLQLALKGEDFVASCDFGTVLTCTDVMQSDQASVFGFANPFIGLMAFPVLMSVGAAMLAGARFAEWFWVGTQCGVTLGVVFVTWLQYQTIVHIGALCPWCIVVWVVTIPLFVQVTGRNLSVWYQGSALTRIVIDWHVLITALWFIAIATAILFTFYL